MARKSLTQWQRQELALWIVGHVKLLASHPFSGHLDLDTLKANLEAAMPPAAVYEEDEMAGSAASAEAKNAEESLPEEALGRQKTADNFDMFEDLFAEFDTEDAQADDNASDNEEDAFCGFTMMRLLVLKRKRSSSASVRFRNWIGCLNPLR